MRVRVPTRLAGSLLPIVAAMAFAGPAGAATLTFATDPFAGSTALTTPGRQVVGGEPSLIFDPTVDTIEIAPDPFGITPPIVAFNGLAGDLTEGFNLIVVRDADGDPATMGNQMAAGLAANLIAAEVTTPGPGFFFYFNTGLNLVRFVYSPDLSTSTSDLAVLARFTNLSGPTGFQAMSQLGPQVTAVVVPEPQTWALMIGGFGLAGTALRRRRSRTA